ncbi:MAG: putative glycoside hydrolase [bacterium]|nr:putative glycoside hydrolase [bacterium]
MFVSFAIAAMLVTTSVHAAQDVPAAAPGGPPISIEPIRAVYLTSGVAASARFEHFLDLLGTTQVNAIVIDLKDANGRIAFRPITEPIQRIAPERVMLRDLQKRVERIHERGGLAIARIAVFQDSWYAESHRSEALQLPGGTVWHDRLGYAWLDPASATVTQYAIDLAHEAAVIGFDEVNFDYIRFPSEGPRFNEIRYPRWNGKQKKREVIRAFARALDTGVRKKGIRTSADVFGQVLWNPDDLGIGQQFELLAPHFDVIAPMVYPSHYRNGFLGKSNPAKYPYEVIFATLQRGMERLAKLPEEQRPAIRPWLQDFNIGAKYGTREVQLQQRAGDDAGAMGWMLWNPLGRYHEDAFRERAR